MNWRVNYFSKLLLQKGLGIVPGLFIVQEWMKAVSKRWDNLLTEQFIHARARQKAQQFMRAGLTVPRVVVEQGTGWHGFDLVFLFLAGVKRIYTFDTRPWLRAHLLHNCCGHADLIAPAVKAWTGAPSREIDRRASLLKRLKHDSLFELLDELCISYQVTTEFNYDIVAGNSCDLFYSDSVLQRVTPKGIAEMLNASRRIVGANGVHHHVIDCKDFHSITDERVPDLYYLRFSDRSWKFLTSTYLNYQNRWRKKEFLDAFHACGIEAKIVRQTVSDANIDWLNKYMGGMVLGRAIDAADDAVTRMEVFARV